MLWNVARFGLVVGLMVLAQTAYAQTNSGTGEGSKGAGVNSKLRVPMVKKVTAKEKTRNLKSSDQPQPPVEGPLSLPQLLDLLRKMGHDEATIEKEHGEDLLVVEEGAYRFSMSISPNSEYVWVHGTVAHFENPANARFDRLLVLLEANNNPYGMFVYGSHWQQMLFQQPVLNQGITPRLLDLSLKNYSAMLGYTAPFWDAAAFPSTP